MTHRPLSALLSLLLALSGAPVYAQVAAGEGAATNSVPQIKGNLDLGLGTPSPALLVGGNALSATKLAPSIDASFSPSLIPSAVSPVGAKTGADVVASKPAPLAAAKTETVLGAGHAVAPSALKPVLPAASVDSGFTADEVKALKLAWTTADQLTEKVEGAPETLAEAPISETPTREHMPSPQDWRDELFHFLLVDRFARAGTVRTHGDQKRGDTRHGGNLKGITSKLDYLKGAAVTTIVLSPVQQNLPESYHGYAPINLFAIDPHMGTMDDFKELVNEAHKRGMKVVLDWVTNHSGPVFEYTEGSKWRGMDGAPKEIGEWVHPMLPKDLQDPKHFTRRGVIDDWSNAEQAKNGDFPPNYRHYASDRKETADALIHVVNWWIQETDIDGLRIDAVRHIAPGFVPEFRRRVKEFAASRGKTNFFLLGEDSTGNDAELLPHLTTNGLDSVFNYPAYRRETYAQHGKAPTKVLEDSFHRSRQELGPLADQLLRFIDGHDVYRFLRLGEPEAQLHVALAYLMFSAGIPMTYAGTEQGFRQDTDRLDPEGPDHPADPGNRADQFDSESSPGDHYDVENPTYTFMAKLGSLRRALAALRRGTQWIRWSDPSGTGLFAFSRIHDGQEVVVALNFSTEEKAAAMWVDAGLTPPGTRLVDAMDASFKTDSYAEKPGVPGSRVFVKVPPLSVRVLVREAK